MVSRGYLALSLLKVGLNSKLYQVMLIQMHLKFIQVTVQSPGTGILQPFWETFFPIFNYSCYENIFPYSSLKIFLVALQSVSLVHSLYFDESGSIHYTVETTTRLPHSLLFFSCVLKWTLLLPLSLQYSLFKSYSSNYLTPCLLFITCTFFYPSPLTDTTVS